MPEYRSFNLARKFFRQTGIPFQEVSSLVKGPSDSFCENTWIDKGEIFYCVKTANLGSVLHEVGHMISIPRSKWNSIQSGDLQSQRLDVLPEPMGEMIAEAWAYAASVKAGIPAETSVQGNSIVSVNVETGDEITDDLSPSIIENLTKMQLSLWIKLVEKKHMGISFLSFLGMTSQEVYPSMKHWLPTETLLLSASDCFRDLF